MAMSDRPPTQLNWVRTSTTHAETVVLIHAVGFDLTYWDRQIEDLQADYNVVAFDLPGHGRSPGKAEDWSFDKAVPVIAGLIESLGAGPVHVAGLSFGGMLAQALVLEHPQLVRSLMLIGTAASFPEKVREVMRARALAIRAGGIAAVLTSSLERWFTPQLLSGRPDIVDRVTKTILADDPGVQAAIWEMIADFDVEARLGEIRCPTLVLVGDMDSSTPPAAARVMAEGIAGASLVVLPNAAHILTVEAPQPGNDELRKFLQALAQP